MAIAPYGGGNTVAYQTHFILYVEDQETSTSMYEAILACGPRLHVPGMTEFDLPGGAVLGLMPAEGIRRLLGPKLPGPAAGAGTPRAEVYILGTEPAAMLDRALGAGARLLSPVSERDWGHRAGYCIDPDGHVLAFAEEICICDRALPQDPVATKRLLLRPFVSDDVEDVCRLAGDRQIADTTAAIPHPYEPRMAEDWIAGHEEQRLRGITLNWAVTLADGGDLVGATSLMNVDRETGLAELGYWVGRSFWGRGYCTEAARAVLAHGFDIIGLERIHAHHMSRNPASGAVLEKIGMIHEGAMRRHMPRWGVLEDIELYGILCTDYEREAQG